MKLFDDLAQKQHASAKESRLVLAVPESGYVNGDSKPFHVVRVLDVGTLVDALREPESAEQPLVLSFADDMKALLDFIVEHGTKMFDATIVRLDGLDETAQSKVFDAATWTCRAVDVVSLIDLKDVRKLAAKSAAPKETVYQKEMRQAVRANGNVKSFDAFDDADDISVDVGDDE